MSHVIVKGEVMIKILVDGIPKEIGGIGTFLYNMARWSKKCDEEPAIKFSFLIPEGSEYQFLLEQIGCETFCVPGLVHHISYSRIIEKVLSSYQFDYVWINNTSKVNKTLLKKARKFGAKIITHPHGVDNEEKGIRKALFHVLDSINKRYYLNTIDIPLSCSIDAARAYYSGSEEILGNAVVINNGIFTDDYVYSENTRRDIRNRYQIEENEILVGTVGRMASVKNHIFLIHIIKKLDMKYKLVILGDGDERTRIEEAVKENGLEGRVILPGQVNNVKDYLSAFDLYVLPSLHEGMPYSVIEAQAEGLQCILSDTVSKETEITDLVSFAKLNDVNDWVEKITHCSERIKNISREQYASKIAESGYGIETSYSRFQSAVCG